MDKTIQDPEMRRQNILIFLWKKISSKWKEFCSVELERKQTFTRIFSWFFFGEKYHQNERCSALCGLNVNKVSRIFSWFFFYVKFAFFGVIIKTPSSGQNCHEVNQSWTLPIEGQETNMSLGMIETFGDKDFSVQEWIDVG